VYYYYYYYYVAVKLVILAALVFGGLVYYIILPPLILLPLILAFLFAEQSDTLKIACDLDRDGFRGSRGPWPGPPPVGSPPKLYIFLFVVFF